MVMPEIVDSQKGYVVIFVIFFVLSLVAVALRLVSRRIVHLTLWWDDFFIILSMIIFIGGFWADIGQLQYGLGRHLAEVGKKNLTPFLIRIYIAEIKYPLAVACNKLSFLFLFLRFFGIDKHFARAAYILMALVVSWGIATTLTAILQCRPVVGAWDHGVPKHKCIDLSQLMFITNILNILLDACILGLPVRRVWKLNLTTRQKVAISAIFLVGLFTTATSILRTYYAYHLSIKDPTYDFTNVSVWSKIEENLGMVCASLPVLLPVVKAVFGPCVLGATRKRSSHVQQSTDKDRFVRLEGGGTSASLQNITRAYSEKDSVPRIEGEMDIELSKWREAAYPVVWWKDIYQDGP